MRYKMIKTHSNCGKKFWTIFIVSLLVLTMTEIIASNKSISIGHSFQWLLLFVSEIFYNKFKQIRASEIHFFSRRRLFLRNWYCLLIDQFHEHFFFTSSHEIRLNDAFSGFKLLNDDDNRTAAQEERKKKLISISFHFMKFPLATATEKMSTKWSP